MSRPSLESFDICSRILVKGVLILSSGVSLLISSIFFLAASVVQFFQHCKEEYCIFEEIGFVRAGNTLHL